MLQKKLFGMVALLVCAVQLNLSANFSCFDNCSLGDFFYDVGGLNYLSLDTGYRYDKVTNRAVLYGPATDVFATTQAQTAINSYILGVKGQYEFKRLLVKGNYHYGWIGDGDYFHGNQKGDLRGHLNDGSIALGFALPSQNCCWLTAFYAGYSYDGLHTHANKVRAPFAGALVNLGKITTKTTIKGPWFGSDIIFRPACDFTLIIGDDIHFGHWNGSNHFAAGDPGVSFGEIEGFSSNSNQHNMWGNVFRVEGYYKVYECWDLGFDLQYTRWVSSGHGRYTPVSSPLPTGITNNYIIDAKWASFSATATIAYVF